MIDSIFEKVKWWTDIEAQQKISVAQTAIIIFLVWVIMQQEEAKESIRVQARIDVAHEQSRVEACHESQLIYVQENVKTARDILSKYFELSIKKKNENTN